MDPRKPPAMDMIQIFGDYLHLLGATILLVKLLLTKNCAGISGKTQLLHALVFTTRYLDLTIVYVSLYDTILKIVFIGITYCTLASIYLFFRNTYDRKRDAFRIELLILPAAVLALFVNRRFESFEVLRTFSLYLEAVAIVPQIYLVSKGKQVEALVVSYVACLGLYQGCYLMHWLLVYTRSERPVNIDLACAIVQLIFYVDLFARNLPILKAKDELARSGKPTGDPEAGLRAKTADTTLRVAAPPAAEKVTLLTAKEPGTSN